MLRGLRIWPSLAYVVWVVNVLSGSCLAAEAPDFDRQVAPLLASRCLECHSGAEPEGGLDLSQAQTVQTGGESGAALVPGKPAASLLWQRIEAGEMPPKHPLPVEEREVIKAWIAAGASWGALPIDPFRFTTSTRAGYDWWSLQPLSRPAVPVVQQAAWPQNEVDRFVLAKLESVGLSPSPPADPRTLLRRVYFDLTGLPPAPEDVDAALAAIAEGAKYHGKEAAWQRVYAEVVDKLLASPAYGERWARHWLDVARFGESDGFEFDRMRPHAWRYRDWVIDALNADMPYDEFAKLQIAGDVLRPGDADALAATGFLVGGPFDGLMPKGETMRAVMRQDELEDLVSITGQAFLGLTVHCARCHDHKFDPVRQSDYFRLAAALAGVKRGNRDIPLEPPPQLVRRHAAATSELAAIDKQARELILAKRRAEASDRTTPKPLASWDFGQSLHDQAGSLHVSLHGGAKRDDEGLALNGKTAYAMTPPLDRPLSEKTLEAWVRLDGLGQRGGGVVGLQSLDGELFDAIVYGEREPGRWIAGSEFFHRTQSLENAFDESEAARQWVHMAIAYHADGRIAVYRQGELYGRPYQPEGALKFESGQAQVVFGVRHLPPGGNKMLSGRIWRARLYDRALSLDEVAASAGTIRQLVTSADIEAVLDVASRDRRRALAKQVAQLDDEIRSYRERKVFAVTPAPAPVVHVLARGSVAEPREVVAAGGIAALKDSQSDFGLAPGAEDSVRRQKLAEWVASEHNPLFARTAANRLWHYHFGRGLVETPNDLGFSGGQPSHPELLDWLASELISRGWSVKALHRQIVLSATYQQTSRPRPEGLAADADNRLLWRYSPRRLDAESIRDAMLLASGLLNPERGCPSFMDFRTYEYKTSQYYEPIDSADPALQRRSIYRFWARGGRNPLLDAFDCPDPSTTTPSRSVTTTPLQALALSNNAFALRMADALASRVLRERPGDDSAQVRRAFDLVYGRPATDEEMAESLAFARVHGMAALCRVLLNTNGFLYVH